MKYPQLVSTKAVNEISDWLIKRLEDLDIEHPGVYSRLLLSLLHTPFKVNAIDLLEDLKQPHHLLNKSNEELKRLAAVESLMEVSAEQNKSNIVNLIDELHSKLRKIETNCEESSMNSRTSNSLNSSPISSSKFYKNLKKIKKNHGMESCSTKNYYLAFPALNGKVSTTITANTNGNITAPASNKTATTLSADIEMNKETNWNFLSWSNLISKKNDDSSTSSKLLNENNSNNGSGSGERMKTPLSRRKRRYGKTQRKSFPKTDVQFSTKSFNNTTYENSTFSPKKMQMVKNSTKKHQRNNYDTSLKTNKNCDIRNNNNFSKNAPKLDLTTTGSTAPWDMDFKGHWEMDRDLIKEFIQQQKGIYHHHHHSQKKQQQQQSFQDFKVVDQIEKCMKEQQTIEKDEDDAMMLRRCLPTKLMIDESPVDDPFNMKVKPCNNKETFSISSLKLKFDENVKAIWSDVDCNSGIDLMKPLTHKQHYFDDDGTLSLASSFTSEKNSLSLFNFNEQTNHHFEVNAPPQQPSTVSITLAPSENNHYHQHQLQQPYKNANINVDYDYNNNSNAMAFYGGRGAMSKSSSSFPISPKQSDQMIKSSDFIKSGTNLQASIWSDGDFPSDADNLVLKEVADLKDDANNVIYKNLSSIGAEIKHWQNCNNNSCSNSNKSNDTDVTLFNHSKRSAFKKFRPLLSSTIIRANYHPLNKSHSERTVIVDSMESENYLTSEKTHFPPIIRDGHTFVIDNNWDEIKYERSPSGENLMYKNRRYKLWNNGKVLSDGNDIDLMGIESDASEFTIKFMLSENDKEVQTNESDFIKPTPPPLSGKSFLEINEEYCKRKIYDEYFKSSSEAFIGNKNKWRYINNAEDSNDYSFFSVNRVKENSNTLNPPTAFHNILLSSNSSSSSICTITSSYDASTIDQFESWRNNVKFNDNSERVETDYKQICMHRLWEQCVTCSKNNEDMHLEKPLPASRLMKDELQLDGDEIMNVIQNLYITSDYCEDDEEKDDNCDDFDDMNHVYMNMILDDSMDGTCTLEDENKFYEPTVDVKNQKNFVESHHHHHQKADLLNLENFDDITLTKMQWQLDKKQEMNKDYEKYLKLLNWIKASLAANNSSNASEQTLAYNADKNNNNCQSLCEVHRPKNRKRRHSTCQNFLENKRTSIEDGFTYRLNLDNSLSPLSTPAPPLSEDYSNLFFDAANMLKVNIEKILLISNPSCIEIEQNKDSIEGANYYRNILQQQHALIKQLDLSRPLTR
ncbi:hypothetical protein PVAND_012052 [Polypedilum vanderplanki]|uniref:Uncharacterized protein n=1 Tax=Polypedilum vanderplanki TaxID=319348 RepID=A0A9J6CM84_POLVA|nr:hypothetical protein PVAND_012052 [Polypedilum vanderplanki]